jgi:hypothetical protein
MVAHLQARQSWHEAAAYAVFQTSRASAYRLLCRVRIEGAVALEYQQHGHPTNMRQPVRGWLTAFYRVAPAPTEQTVQGALLECFGLEREGQSRHSSPRDPGCQPPGVGCGENIRRTGLPPGSTWREGAGRLLFLAAAHQTGVITA